MAKILYIDMLPWHPSQAQKLAGIRRYARLRGWEVACIPREELRSTDIPSILARHRPIGVIAEGSGRMLDCPPRVFGSIPVAYIEYPAAETNGKAPNVVIDDNAVADAAFRELSHGRPDSFAAVGYPTPHLWSRLRIDAFVKRCAREGVGCAVFHGRRNESRDDYRARLEKWISALPSKTAIFTDSDTAAVAATHAARAAARHIPKDLTLCSTCDVPEVCERATPPATSIPLDFERMGFVAARALGEIIGTTGTTGTAGTTGTTGTVGTTGTTVTVGTTVTAGTTGTTGTTGTAGTTGTTGTAGTTGTTGICFSSGLSHPSHPSHPSQLILPIGPLLVTRRKTTSGRGRHEPWVLKAVEIIRAEACEGLAIADLVARLETGKGRPVSRRNFDRRFQEAMGHTANEEIISVRLESACALLAQTDIPVTFVHDFCGFGCYSNLDAQFRSRFGMSMTRWREKNAR